MPTATTRRAESTRSCARSASIRERGASVEDIVLGPLSLDEVGQLVADTLGDESSRVAPLSRLVHEKTGGNPFFVIQFLLSLRDDGLLARDEATAWRWDLARIVSRGFTDNLADFMVAKLNRLPQPARVAMTRLACLGRAASKAVLARVCDQSEGDLHAALREAVLAGLVVEVDAGYEFPHDRVQEASHALASEVERAAIHRRAGRILAELDGGSRRDELIFEIVNHLNRAGRSSPPRTSAGRSPKPTWPPRSAPSPPSRSSPR